MVWHLAAKARDEKLAERQKAPGWAPFRKASTGPPAAAEPEERWGFFQWDRYATPWEVSPRIDFLLS